MTEDGSGPTLDTTRRRRLAAIAFVGHVPGLKLLTAAQLTPALRKANVVAAVVTLGAMWIAYATIATSPRWWAPFVAWLVGHFAWSFVFSGWILRGGAVTELDEAERSR